MSPVFLQARGSHISVKSFVTFSSSARAANLYKLSYTLLTLFLSKSLQLTSSVLTSYWVNANWPVGRIRRGSEPNRNGYKVLYCG